MGERTRARPRRRGRQEEGNLCETAHETRRVIEVSKILIKSFLLHITSILRDFLTQVGVSYQTDTRIK